MTGSFRRPHLTKEQLQEAHDLALHAVTQYTEMFQRTLKLTPNPLAGACVARELCLAAVVSHASCLMSAAKMDGASVDFESVLAWVCAQTAKDAMSFAKDSKDKP